MAFEISNPVTGTHLLLRHVYRLVMLSCIDGENVSQVLKIDTPKIYRPFHISVVANILKRWGTARLKQCT